MVSAERPTLRHRARAGLGVVVSIRNVALQTDLALVAVRIALAWIFIYYGGGKLFAWFHATPSGIHQSSIFFANTAHLHPGGLFAVLGGVTEFGGAIAVALGLASRLAGLALFGDMVIAMITVNWQYGINSEKLLAGYELNVALAVLALVIVLLGPGRFSIDALVARRVVAMENRSGR
jgi:putative oxidoreductase